MPSKYQYATGYLACPQNGQYPYGVLSDLSECLPCLQDDQYSYRVFSVHTDFSVSVRVFSVPAVCLACLEYKCSYRVLIVPKMCLVSVQGV
jgi:hypothetical protein